MEKFEDILRNHGINEDHIRLMREYAEFLLEENAKYNLTRITDPKDMAYFHFLDSIAGSNSIPENARVIDIGTGGGFPGIPLKIVRPDLDMTLVDASHKKIEFVHRGAERLGISVTTAAKRAEEIKEWRGSFDIVVSRAMAALNVLLELCVPFLKMEGKLLAYKGADAKEEIQSAANALSVLGCTLETREAGIPGREHVILEIQKKKPTPDKYPRRFAKIKSDPL